MLVPVDEAGLFVAGLRRARRAQRRTRCPTSSPPTSSAVAGCSAQEPHEHRYPHCWRCGTKLIFRVVDEWFIRCDEIRQPMIDANAHGRVDARALRQAHGGLAAQHGRLVHLAQALLGPAAAVLVLRGRPHERRRLAGGAARARDRRPRRARGAAPALDRPGHDRLRRVRRPRPRACPRSATAGWTRASSRSRRSATAATAYEPEGFAAGAGVGLTKADLPDHAYWEKWFPADWISEMREQIRLWFYSQLFMSVALVGQAPYRRVLGYEKLHDEHGRADAQVVGQRDLVRRRDREDRRRRQPLDVRRPGHRPEHELRLRPGRTTSRGAC